MRQPAHVRAAGFMAQHQRIGLGAVQQAQRDAGIGRMEQRALAFDQVPAGILPRGRDPFGGAGDEIRHHRIDRHAGAGDEDAGLAGGAEIGPHAARAQFAFDRQRGVHLAHRAVGAHRQQAPAGTAAAVAHGQRRRLPRIEQEAPVALGRGHDPRMRRQPLVQAGGDVHAGIERLHHVLHGFGIHDAAGVGDADDHGVGAGLHGLAEVQVRQVERGPAVAAAELADAPLRPPMGQTARGLGRQVIRRIAQVQQVRRRPAGSGRGLGRRSNRRHGSGQSWNGAVGGNRGRRATTRALIGAGPVADDGVGGRATCPARPFLQHRRAAGMARRRRSARDATTLATGLPADH